MPFGAAWRFPTMRLCNAFANCASSSACRPRGDRTVPIAAICSMPAGRNRRTRLNSRWLNSAARSARSGVASVWYASPARWAAALAVVALALASGPATRSVSTPRDLVSVADARQLAQLAAEKDLPLPAFRITSLAEDVPDTIRRFVGVWVSDTGWAYSDRQSW